MEKTPGNAFAYERIATCWPDARFVFLLRHPVSIAQSWHEAEPRQAHLRTRPRADALRYMKAVAAGQEGPAPAYTVRYEDITADPEKEMRRHLRLPRHRLGTRRCSTTAGRTTPVS